MNSLNLLTLGCLILSIVLQGECPIKRLFQRTTYTEHGFYKVAVGEHGAGLFGIIAGKDLVWWFNGSLTEQLEKISGDNIMKTFLTSLKKLG